MRITQLAVTQILKHAEHYPWQLQGFGMLRLYLSDDVRLHIWSTRHVVENVSVIHDHPWDFESIVLCGALRDVTYDVETSARPRTHHEQRILCGPGGGLVDVPLNVRLVARPATVYGPGQRHGTTYYHKWDGAP